MPRARRATISDHAADSRGQPTEVVEIVTAGGVRIFLLPVETFPGHVNNLYWIEHDDLASKRVFVLMLFLTTLTNKGSDENQPVLTIPTN